MHAGRALLDVGCLLTEVLWDVELRAGADVAAALFGLHKADLVLEALHSDGNGCGHAQRDVRVPEGHPMLGNAAQVHGSLMELLLGQAIGCTDLFQQRLPIARLHSSSKELNQLGVLVIAEVLSQLGKGLPGVVGNISIGEIMVYIFCFHGFSLVGWGKRGVLMTCSENTCGTGIGSAILPGDPDNNSLLTATPAFGGVEISWTLPSTNAHGVAYVRIYRGLTDSFASGLIIANASGDRYFDRFDWSTTVPTNLYYWIQFVSINGTIGEPIGPASAVPRRTIDEVIQQLTAQIDYSMLSVELKGTVDKAELYKQAQDAVNTALGVEQISIRDALALVQQDIDGAFVLISNEVQARQSAGTAFASSLNTLAVATENNLATAQTELQTYIDELDNKVGALYTAKLTVNGLVGGFGIYNDGTQVEAGFDVDTFWVGRTNLDKKKPFIISGGEVFIDQAVIEKLTFSKLTSANGSFIVSNGKIQGDYLRVTSASIDDAAITTAKIGNAQVGTLSIANNAVSVSQAATVVSTYTNSNTLTVVTTEGTGGYAGYFGNTALNLNATVLTASLIGLANGALQSTGTLSARVTQSGGTSALATLGMYVDGNLVRSWTISTTDGILSFSFTSIKTFTNNTNPTVEMRLMSVVASKTGATTYGSSYSVGVTVEVFPNTSTDNGTSIYCLGLKR